MTWCQTTMGAVRRGENKDFRAIDVEIKLARLGSTRTARRSSTRSPTSSAWCGRGLRAAGAPHERAVSHPGPHARARRRAVSRGPNAERFGHIGERKEPFTWLRFDATKTWCAVACGPRARLACSRRSRGRVRRVLGHAAGSLGLPGLKARPVKPYRLTGRQIGLVLDLSVRDQLIACVAGTKIARADPHLARQISWERQPACGNLRPDAAGNVRIHPGAPRGSLSMRGDVSALRGC